MNELIHQLPICFAEQQFFDQRTVVIKVNQQRFRIDCELECLFFLRLNAHAFDARAVGGADLDVHRSLKKCDLRILRFRIGTLFLPHFQRE